MSLAAKFSDPNAVAGAVKTVHKNKAKITSLAKGLTVNEQVAVLYFVDFVMQNPYTVEDASTLSSSQLDTLIGHIEQDAGRAYSAYERGQVKTQINSVKETVIAEKSNVNKMFEIISPVGQNGGVGGVAQILYQKKQAENAAQNSPGSGGGGPSAPSGKRDKGKSGKSGKDRR
jgi:hypothetical protein